MASNAVVLYAIHHFSERKNLYIVEGISLKSVMSSYIVDLSTSVEIPLIIVDKLTFSDKTEGDASAKTACLCAVRDGSNVWYGWTILTASCAEDVSRAPAEAARAEPFLLRLGGCIDNCRVFLKSCLLAWWGGSV